MKYFHIAFWIILTICFRDAAAVAQQPAQAPPGMFKDLDDAIVGNALIIRGKQLFIDDYLIEELRGTVEMAGSTVLDDENAGSRTRLGLRLSLQKLGQSDPQHSQTAELQEIAAT